jgi:hypothetical protein
MTKFSFLFTILLIVHSVHETFNLEICNENCQIEPFLNLEEKILENINHTKTLSPDDDKSNSDNHEHENYETSHVTFMNESENLPTVNNDGNSISNLTITNSKSVNWSYLMLHNKSYNTKNLGSLNFINRNTSGRNFVEYDQNHHQPQQNQQANNVILNHNNNDNEILQMNDEGNIYCILGFSMVFFIFCMVVVLVFSMVIIHYQTVMFCTSENNKKRDILEFFFSTYSFFFNFGRTYQLFVIITKKKPKWIYRTTPIQTNSFISLRYYFHTIF